MKNKNEVLVDSSDLFIQMLLKEHVSEISIPAMDFNAKIEREDIKLTQNKCPNDSKRKLELA